MGNMGTPNAGERHRSDFITGLRQLADLLERFPELPVPAPALINDMAHIDVRLLTGDIRARFVTSARTLGATPVPTSWSAVQLRRQLGSTEPGTGLVYRVTAWPKDLWGAPDDAQLLDELREDIVARPLVQA